MTIHKEGRKTIITTFLIAALFFIASRCVPNIFGDILNVLFWIAFVSGFILTFFYRFPNRSCSIDNKTIYAPADGKIVAFEKVVENNYFKSERLQVSIFMNVTDVHVNWVPISGKIVWKEHSDGKNYPAHNPKASGLNENCKTVIELSDGTEVMVNQIAGIMARRVVNNKEIGETVTQGEELGIIKFGSRVDLFLPLNSNVLIRMGQRVKAKKTILARF